MKSAQAVLQCENLSKIYKTGDVETRAVDGVSVKITHGEFIAIMGPSGSGKSTFMHLLGLLDRPTEGAVVFDETNIETLTDDDLARFRNQKIGFVFQAFNLLPRASVYENVFLPLLYDIYTNKSTAQREKIVRDALESVGMTHRIENTPAQLSGGEKQRVAIARALVNSPQVIFADEPTGNLDSKSGLQVMKILDELNQKGHTIILVTHETETAKYAKRLLSMKDGMLVGDESMKGRRSSKTNGALK